LLRLLARERKTISGPPTERKKDVKSSIKNTEKTEAWGCWGRKRVAMDKPMFMPMTSPAIITASKINLRKRPLKKPKINSFKMARKKCPVVANSMGFWSVYKKSIKERAVAKKTLKVFGNSSLPKKGTIKRKEITLTWSKKRVKRLFRSREIIGRLF
jgi:hypothetical protein